MIESCPRDEMVPCRRSTLCFPRPAQGDSVRTGKSTICRLLVDLAGLKGEDLADVARSISARRALTTERWSRLRRDGLVFGEGVGRRDEYADREGVGVSLGTGAS